MRSKPAWIAAVLTITLALTVIPARLVHAQSAAGASDPARLAAARELIIASNGAKMFDTMIKLIMHQMSEALIHQKPEDAAVVRDVFAALTSKAIARKQEVIDKVAVVYAKRFTVAELTALADFYKSDVGAKFISQQRAIVRESMQIGQRWGMKLGQEVQREAREQLQRSRRPQ